ncbi:MAG: DUF11 domain-containing protein [Anaerolineales bacterium]|nr:DUF11 domain-containing protein [Anaerolineales bacterium]
MIENNAPNPVVVDLDGDGLREILYPSYDGRVHAYWLDKTEHGSWPFEVTGANEGFIRFATEPIVVDLDNNGKAEVIFASWTQNDSNKPGRLYVVSWDGKLIDAVELPFNVSDGRGGALGAPTIANIDADPDLELVLGTINRGLVAYDIGNSANARILWGTGRGNYLRAGVVPTQVKGTLATSQKLVDKAQAEPNDPLHYTIRLLNPGALLPSARLTDTLPTNATLVTGTVQASSGQVAVAGGRILWDGEVSSTQPVTVTYTMTAGGTPGKASVIRNTALIDNDQGTVITRTAVTILGGEAVYLPKIENR